MTSREFQGDRMSRWLRCALGAVAGVLLAAASAVVGPPVALASPGQVVTDVAGGVTAAQMAQLLAGPGMTVSNATYTGSPQAAGTFSGMGSVGFDSGVALSSGALTGSSGNLLGPNDYYKMSTQFLTPGDADLTDLSGVTTLDAAVLEFDFVATDPQVRLAYVFGSEEYNESLEGPNDVFALYVNGTNCATAGTPPGLVRSSTVNLNSNAQLYRNNEDDLIDVELDGLTTVLTCSATVTAGATNHAKLAIADVTHYGWDSDVLIQAGSFRVDPPATVPSAPTIGTATAGNAQATVSWAAPGSNGGAAINGYVVTPYVNGVAQTATTFNSTATTQTVTGLTNGTAYTFRVAARNAIGTGPQSAASNAVTPASAATVPGAPTIGSAVARDAEVSLSWTAPVSNGGAAINGYVVTPYVNGVAQAARTFGSTATSQVITGLVNGTANTFRVAARNAVGVGPQSAMSNAATPTGDLGRSSATARSPRSPPPPTSTARSTTKATPTAPGTRAVSRR